MKRAHLTAFSALVMLVPTAAMAASGDEFAQSYGLEVGEDHGGCLFFLTDTGLTAAEVTTKLTRDGYDISRGLEVLVTRMTPRRCGDLGRQAALKAGFKAVRVRLATSKDRWIRP